MREMNILQEEDLPYFEELEKAGKAVILRFDSLDDLMNFDFGALLGEDEREPELKEIEEWISQQKDLIKRKGEEAENKEAQITQNEQQILLLQKLQECSLPAMDKALITRAIDLKMPYHQILELLEPEIAYEQRQTSIREFQAKQK